MMGLRARLLFPLGAFVLLWGAYTIAAGEGGRVAPAVLLGLLAVLLGVMATNAEYFVMRPLRRLLQAAQDLTQDPPTTMWLPTRTAREKPITGSR